MASANSSFPPEDTCHYIRDRNRHADTHDSRCTPANIYCVKNGVREKPPLQLEAASALHSDALYAASHAAPPMPSRSLRSLSFCVAILAVFAAHLHLASLSLLISRGLPQFPLLDHTVDRLRPDQSMSSKRTGTPTVSRALGDTSSTDIDPPLRRKIYDSALNSTSEVVFSASQLPRALVHNASNLEEEHMVSVGPVLELSQAPAESTSLFGSLANVIPLLSRAGKEYVLRTFVEVLKAPSPLPQNVTLVEDSIIAWHLLLQALGCLLFGVLADVKGRRSVLCYSVQLLGVASFLFTLTALFTAHFSLKSTKECNGQYQRSSTNTPQTGAAELFLSHCLDVFEKPSESSTADSQTSTERTSIPPGWTFLLGGRPPTGKLTALVHAFSSPSLWALAVHVLTFCSVACYSLAAIACGGVVVVAQCLCLEAAAPFPLKPTKDAGLRRSFSTATLTAGSNFHLSGIRGDVADAGSLIADDTCRGQVASGVGDELSDPRTREHSTASVFLASIPPTSDTLNTKELGLRSPLLLEGTRSPAVPQAMRTGSAHLCGGIRSLPGAFWRGCSRTHLYASVRRILCSGWRLFAPISFFSSPYTPVAYLVGAQSAAYLFLPVVLSVVLKKLPISAFSRRGDFDAQLTSGTLSPFALFCLAFSIPILPVCVLLYVLTSRYLRENPYYIFQRKVLLQHLLTLRHTYSASRHPLDDLTMELNPSRVRIPFVPPLARSTLAVIKRREPAVVYRLSAISSPPSQRRRTSAHLKECDNEPPSRSSSLSSSVPALPVLSQSSSIAYAIRGKQCADPVRLSSRITQSRRAVSCSDGNNFTSVKHKTPPQESVPIFHNAHLPEVLERQTKAKCLVESEELLSHGRDSARGARGDEARLSTAQGSAGQSSKRLLSVQPATAPIRAGSESVADVGVLGKKLRKVKTRAEGRLTGPPNEAAAAPRSRIIDATWRSLRVYRLYLQFTCCVSLRGVMLPAAFIGAAFYLRGIFRFLLLDCVVIEDEVEGGSQAATFELTSSDIGASNPHNVTSVQASSPSQPVSSTGASSSSFFCSSLSCLLSYSGVIEAAPHLRDVFAEMLLFRLSTPVLLVRLCTCLAPISFLSVLPPKPMQMLGCIFCAFMSFGIAVTLEALAQNFPDIPPISSAKTASLLYEMVFCCCCSIPAFTAILLPMQGFHTGVRCAFTATTLACVRVAAAVSLVSLSFLLSYVAGVPYEEGSEGANSAVLGKSMFAPDVILSGPPNVRSVAGNSSNTAGKPTSSSDTCSSDAAIIAFVTCVYYVVAAALTLLYTTHIRLPQEPIPSQIEKRFQRRKLQKEKLISMFECSTLKGKHGVLLQDRYPSQSWITQWTDSAREGTLLAVDNLWLYKLRPPRVTCNSLQAEDDDRESEAASES